MEESISAEIRVKVEDPTREDVSPASTSDSQNIDSNAWLHQALYHREKFKYAIYMAEMNKRFEKNWTPNESKLVKLNHSFQPDERAIEKKLNDKLNAQMKEFDSPNERRKSENQSRKRISMSQNYKGAISNGFSRMLFQSVETQSEMYITFLLLLGKYQGYYKSTASQPIFELEGKILKYVRDYIHGKSATVSSSQKVIENPKINNSETIAKFFFSDENDTELIQFCKKVVFELLIYFMESKYYIEWILKDCSSTLLNKIFLIINATEIKRVFADPLFYKPKFKNIEYDEKNFKAVSFENFLRIYQIAFSLASKKNKKEQDEIKEETC